ncbi:hypothetical protein LEMLEM_LOCUS14303, partial [Lemmus lemmus]
VWAESSVQETCKAGLFFAGGDTSDVTADPELLNAGQVAFHTDDTELWKDSGSPRMTGHLSGVHQPA